jgi:hypothetical protein
MQSMKTISIFLLAWLVSASCARVNKNESSSASDSTTTVFDYSMMYALESYLAPDHVAASDIQMIDTTCAVIIYPSPGQFEQMEQDMGEDFETMVDDGNFYQSAAVGMLDSLGVKTVMAKSRYIGISGHSLTLDMRKKHLPAWNLILYNVHKQPIIVSSATLTVGDIVAYFEIGN